MYESKIELRTQILVIFKIFNYLKLFSRFIVSLSNFIALNLFKKVRTDNRH